MALIRRTTQLGDHDPIRRWIFGPDAFPEFFGPLFRSLYGEVPLRVEEYMDGDTLVIKVELPGIDPDKDIELTIGDGTLHIHAERRVEKEIREQDLYRSEFRYGGFVKSLPLPVGFDEKTVEATYKAGILEIRVPIDQAKTSATKIPVSTG
jgi:HSP20 family protein